MIAGYWVFATFLDSNQDMKIHDYILIKINISEENCYYEENANAEIVEISGDRKTITLYKKIIC